MLEFNLEIFTNSAKIGIKNLVNRYMRLIRRTVYTFLLCASFNNSETLLLLHSPFLRHLFVSFIHVVFFLFCFVFVSQK